MQTYLSLSISYTDNFVDSCCINGLFANITFQYEYLSGGFETILFGGLQFLEINADRLIIVGREGEDLIIIIMVKRAVIQVIVSVIS